MKQGSEQQNTEYVVSLDSFEGPLDLLHRLIEGRKMQINTVALAKVTADYLRHVRQTVTVSAEEIARFTHIASILILIKSKSLLPMLNYTTEEEADVAELERRVRLLGDIRKRAVPVFSAWQVHSYLRRPERSVPVAFTPDASCTTPTLWHNARTALRHVVILRRPPEKRITKGVSIEEVIERVLTEVTSRVTVSFKKIASGRDRQEKIVSFLAVLELVRKDVIQAEQRERFDDIVLSQETQTAV